MLEPDAWGIGNCLSCAKGTLQEGFDCPGGTSVEDTSLLPGYWRVSRESTLPRACSISVGSKPEFCPGGDGGLPDEPLSYCQANHLGALCATCDRGNVIRTSKFFKGFQGGCVECEFGIPIEAVVLALASLALLGLAVYLFTRLSVDTKIRFFSFFKITFVMLQILVAVPVVFKASFPGMNSFVNFLNILTLPSLDFSFALGAECYTNNANFYLRLFMTSGAPLCVIMMLGGITARKHHTSTGISPCRLTGKCRANGDTSLDVESPKEQQDSGFVVVGKDGVGSNGTKTEDQTPAKGGQARNSILRCPQCMPVFTAGFKKTPSRTRV
jgi:hypothetical protein